LEILMSTAEIVTAIIVAVLVLALAAAVIFLLARMRSRKLQERFGPEYDRAVAESESRRDAERELREREKRHEALELRPLSSATRERYAREWQTVQAQFVDYPDRAVGEADRLITALMGERGYPTEGDDQRLADLSVEHASVLGHYRDARAISARSSEGKASTEELRTAMVHFRALFDELLREGGAGSDRSRRSDSHRG
jgi:hypothetical protein